MSENHAQTLDDAHSFCLLHFGQNSPEQQLKMFAKVSSISSFVEERRNQFTDVSRRKLGGFRVQDFVGNLKEVSSFNFVLLGDMGHGFSPTCSRNPDLSRLSVNYEGMYPLSKLDRGRSANTFKPPAPGAK